MDRRIRGLILPGLFTLAGFGVLVGLGAWQVERMGAKQRLIDRVEARLTLPAVPVPPESDWPGLQAKAVDYLKVSLSGRFLHDKEARLNGFLSGSRTGDTTAGSFILTPLVLADGSTVIVNRGFVPTALVDPASRKAGQVDGTVMVTGLLRPPEMPGYFVPANDPARNIWFSRKPDEIAAAFGLVRAAPFVVEADATANPGGWPKGGNTRVSFPNNHLQYALTWFALAIAILAVFFAFARQRLRAPPA